jgi:serpin B
LFKAAFCLALIFTLGGFRSCNSDLDDRVISDAKPIILNLTEKIETDNSFAFDLFKTTYQSSDEKNVFVSPLSVNMALCMTLNGAAGETSDEMKEALRAKNYSLDEINNFNKSLREALLKVDTTTSISIANSIWYRNTLTVKKDFISVNKNYYVAEVNALDFNSPNAAKQINNWVSDKTNKKIPVIIQQISPETMMYLINAIYFKGVWKSKFKKNDTQDEYFHPGDDLDMYKVNMMKQTTHFPYTEDDNCRYLKMVYGNQAFSMILMLPQDDKTVDDVIANLNSESWRNAMRMVSYEVNLRLPRFKSECEYKMEEAILPAMGMKIPFTDLADFSGITDFPLKISTVIHKTFIEVNEEGTEAAAVTVVGMKDASAGPPPPGTIIDYIVNKPFAFAICENSTGVILFMGKMEDIR